MPRRAAPRAHCPDPLHAVGRVRAWGTYTTTGGAYRQYRCEPLAGDPHYFSVGIAGGHRKRASAVGSPECPDHRHSRITRQGNYREARAGQRQRYECDHDGACNDHCRQGCAGDHEGPCVRTCGPRCRGKSHDGPCLRACPRACTGAHDGACVVPCERPCPGTHTFTPPLPRHHVAAGDQCAECLELRGYHRGEVAVARRHRLAARTTAKLLNDLSQGTSYALAGKEALAALGITVGATVRRRPSETPPPARPRLREANQDEERRPRSIATRISGRCWHVGAGLVEAFSPVLWAQVEADLRERAVRNRALGPAVWIIDEQPIYALDANRKRKKTDGYSVLVLAELDWSDPADPGAAKIRLVRALPKATSVAWRLVFDEMGYRPDMVLSDAGTPIIAAVKRHWSIDPPLLVPSTWHLGRALESNALKVAVRGNSPESKALRDHLGELRRDGSALSSVEGWHAWWRQLRDLGRATKRVKIADLDRSRTNYEARMADALPALLADPRLRQSTGGIESLIRTWVEPLLARRRHSFANIERTNNLLDLAVCRSEGLFRDLNRVARLIEEDEGPHGGWTVPLRSIADPQPRRGWNRSLRDEGQMIAVADERGLL